MFCILSREQKVHFKASKNTVSVCCFKFFKVTRVLPVFRSHKIGKYGREKEREREKELTSNKCPWLHPNREQYLVYVLNHLSPPSSDYRRFEQRREEKRGLEELKGRMSGKWEQNWGQSVEK